MKFLTITILFLFITFINCEIIPIYSNQPKIDSETSATVIYSTTEQRNGIKSLFSFICSNDILYAFHK